MTPDERRATRHGVFPAPGAGLPPADDVQHMAALLCDAFPDIAAKYSDTEIRQRLLMGRQYPGDVERGAQP